ncbi:MAG: endonuclease III [Clostridia bacterium]|nr:endonuclease III [Clostridia bacterium]
MNAKEQSVDLVKRLIDYYPKSKCELDYSSNYELLVAVILSAQCTDKRVNIVTKELFEVANTPEKMLLLGEEKLKHIIKPCGFYNNKAKNIISASKDLVSSYHSVVPNTREELMKLSGVGEKTASVVLAVAFGVPAIAVDTHVFRLSKRLKLANKKTPTETMHALEKLLPKAMWSDGHFALVLHGRYVCKAIKPNCGECLINDKCPSFNKIKK